MRFKIRQSSKSEGRTTILAREKIPSSREDERQGGTAIQAGAGTSDNSDKGGKVVEEAGSLSLLESDVRCKERRR